MLTIPYVTTAAFKAHPTFLDLLNLRSGDPILADQDDELREILLKASAMCDSYLELGPAAANDNTLQAHSRTERDRIRVDRQGRLKWHPDHKPVTAVTAVSYGSDPRNLQPVTDLTGLWIERERQVVLSLGYPGGVGMSAIQFGSPAYDSEVYLQYTYGAGYPNTLLATAAPAGATSINVLDATGITSGNSSTTPTTLRIWDPGSEEAVTVASSYAGGLTLPLVSPLQFGHPNSQSTGVSGMPHQVHLATIFYACALLMRPDSESEDVFPGARRDTNTRIGGGPHDGSGWVEEAERQLDELRRVR